MPLTIGEARNQVLEHLDDFKGRRYANDGADGFDYTRLDRALRSSIGRCLDDYVGAGGDRFDEDISVTTDTDGKVELGGYKIQCIRGVLSEPSEGNLYPLEEGDKLVRGLPDRTARDLRLVIVRTHEIPSPADDDDLLVGTVAGAARSFDSFDEWVCARAAMQLGIKDKEGLKRVGEHLADLGISVLSQPRIPRSYPWPQPRNRISSLRDLRWIWLAREQRLELILDRRSPWGG